jgi:hypothetical protein
MHKADEIMTYPQTCIDGMWVKARPINYKWLRRRIKSAWMVLTGKADAVIFYKQ